MFKKIFSLGVVLVVGLCVLCGCSSPKKMGTFYTLEEAYENGWLTQDDLMSIAYYHNGGREGNEEIMSEDYEPAPKTPEILSEATEKAIRRTYWYEVRTKFSLKQIGIGDHYYGCYNNCVAVIVWCGESGYSDVEWEDNVGGVKFIYLNENSIKIWIKEE